MYRDVGDGPDLIVEAETMAEACTRLVPALFDGADVDWDEEVVAEMPVIEGEPLEVRAVLYELSAEQGIEPTTNADDLVYLGPVLEVDERLRLVVAWEAVSPRQDFAVGIFRVAHADERA